ncbi:MAG: LPS export ABC transporter permease LptF [Gammaproteobacteria bacterium]|nr:LPS export ABC transporter permease LptF [Gammaproteobacteria bacterium]
MPRLIDRYVIREIAVVWFAVAVVLTILFASFSSMRFMAEAASETLSLEAVFQLVGLRTLIALEVLLPLALYLAVVMGLGRLHSDSELVALQAVGVGEGRLLVAVAWLAVPLGMAAGALALEVRPWAYDMSYVLEAREEAESLVDRVRADRFESDGDGERVIHARRVDAAARRLEEVYIYRRDGEHRDIFLARSAEQPQPVPGRPSTLVLEQGSAYRFEATGRTRLVLRFKRLTLHLEETETVLGYKRKAAPTAELADSDSPHDVAEYQWRLSRPAATVLLALLAVPLSRSAPRRGRYGRVFLAVVAYGVYYNLGSVARTWVEQGAVPPLPGLWWPHALLALVLAVVYRPRRGRP